MAACITHPVFAVLREEQFRSLFEQQFAEVGAADVLGSESGNKAGNLLYKVSGGSLLRARGFCMRATWA